jgi:hypothetical protein
MAWLSRDLRNRHATCPSSSPQDAPSATSCGGFFELAYSSLSSTSRGWGAINQIHPEMAHPFAACVETISSTSRGWRATKSEPCFTNAGAYSFRPEMAHPVEACAGCTSLISRRGRASPLFWITLKVGHFEGENSHLVAAGPLDSGSLGMMATPTAHACWMPRIRLTPVLSGRDRLVTPLKSCHSDRAVSLSLTPPSLDHNSGPT